MTDAEVAKMATDNLVKHVTENKARYAAFTTEIAEFPYTAEAAAKITYRMWVEIQEATYAGRETIDALNAETNGGLARVLDLFGDADYRGRGGRVDRDFTRVINGLTRGTVKSELGEAIELDRFGCPNIAPYMAGCRESISVPIDKVDDIDLKTFVAPWHGTVTTDFMEFRGLTNPKYTYMEDGYECAALPYNLLWPWDMYRIIVNLCAAGFEKAIRTVIGRKRTDAKREAAAQGAIVSLDGHLTSPSSKEFWQAFMPGRIMRLPYSVKEETFDSDGRLNELALGDKNLVGITTLQENFLHAMERIVELKIQAGDYDEQTKTISFHAGILDQMGIDPRGTGKRRDGNKRDVSDTRTMAQRRFDKLVNEILPPFDPLVGCMPNGSIYRLLAFSDYDADTETITLFAPYFWQVGRTVFGDKGKPQVHHYLHANAGSRRSDAAFELANRIIIGVVQRGSVPDPKKRGQATSRTRTKKLADGSTVTDTTRYETKADRQLARERARTELIQAIEAATTQAARTRAGKRLADFDKRVEQEEYELTHPVVTYRARYQTLIDDCPQVKASLNRILTDTTLKHPRQSYNDYLRKTFEAAYSIIMEQSDLPKKYRDLHLPTVKRKKGGKSVDAYDVPSMSTLGRTMVITHRGKIPERR